MAETLFLDYRRQHGLPIKVVRIFNTYGPGMQPNDGRVVSNFIIQALRNQPITVYGDGSQTRSFCYVSEMVRALELMMESPEEVTGPINLGNPVEVTVRQLADQIIEKTGSRSNIVEAPLPSDDPVQRCPDISRARELLSWSPSVGLDEGLDQTIRYFEKILGSTEDGGH